MRLAILRKLSSEIVIEYDPEVFKQKIKESLARKLTYIVLGREGVIRKVEESFEEVYKEMKDLTIEMPNTLEYKTKYREKTIEELSRLKKLEKRIDGIQEKIFKTEKRLDK